MCSNYQPPTPDELMEWIGSGLPPTFEYGERVFPLADAPILLHDEHARLAPVRASFGLRPHWAKEATFGKRTYNARSETVAKLPSFRDAWKKRQTCLVPAASFNEPEYDASNKSHWMSIGRVDRQPFALAGLWETRTEDDRKQRSFTMLTVAAAGHPLMDRFHAPGDEKRSVVVIAPGDFTRWLTATDDDELREMLQLMPAKEFTAWNRGS